MHVIYGIGFIHFIYKMSLKKFRSHFFWIFSYLILAFPLKNLVWIIFIFSFLWTLICFVNENYQFSFLLKPLNFFQSSFYGKYQTCRGKQTSIINSRPVFIQSQSPPFPGSCFICVLRSFDHCTTDLSTGSSPCLNWVVLCSFQKIETTLNYQAIAP